MSVTISSSKKGTEGLSTYRATQDPSAFFCCFVLSPRQVRRVFS
jgi:hypothetical protein